jgi:hypothetical protein
MPETVERPAPPATAFVPPAPATHPEPAANPATAGMKTVAVVLTDTRRVVVGQHTYHVPPGQVIRILTIPVSQHFDDGMDTKIVDAGDLKLGDTVKE